jgi:hypothetical protein
MSGRLARGGNIDRSGETAGTSPGEGGFAFDEATMQTLIKKWLALADHYEISVTRADMGSMTPEQLAPGLDIASEAQAKAALSSAQAYQVYLRKNHEYCINQAQLLRVTLDDYLGQEHQRVRDINNAGPQAGI